MGLPDPPPDEDDIRNNRREKGINAMGVYALGFMTHAILDRHCHPYIVYKSDREFHGFLERIIDVLMLKELRGKETASWDQNEVLAAVCANPPLGLKEIIARALAKAFPDKVNRDPKLSRRIDNTFADCAGFYAMTSPARIALAARADNSVNALLSFGMRSLVYVFPENLSPEIDFLNFGHTDWRYPYVPPGMPQAHGADSRSFLQIYADALEAGINALSPCIFQYLDTGIFPIAEAARGMGNMSLSIQDEEGKPCAPNLQDPFPLVDVLRQQGRLRGML
jgi:hypothetical protein